MKEIVLSEAEISDICKNLGQKITDEIKDEEKLPILVGIMKGGLNFTMDLLKNITAPVLTDYIQISSYSGTSTTGIINMKKDMTLDCKDRTVILVEDVVDSGYSIHYLKNYLFEKHRFQ
jgi:hypoxanthine phosphoribosyltransferase